jgi:K+-transporting ATPase KdpC subunit
MRRNLISAVLYTFVTTVIFGLVYPLVVTGVAQMLFKDKANGQLIQEKGQLIGSRIIGQPFTSPNYFHSRPSAAGNGYDAANSSGSNYAPTNKKLIDRVAGDVAALQVEHPGTDVPVDLVTASASGLDPTSPPLPQSSRSRASRNSATSPRTPSAHSSYSVLRDVSSASSASRASMSLNSTWTSTKQHHFLLQNNS